MGSMYHKTQRDFEITIRFTEVSIVDNPEIQLPYALHLLEEDVKRFVEEELDEEAQIEIKASDPVTIGVSDSPFNLYSNWTTSEKM